MSFSFARSGWLLVAAVLLSACAPKRTELLPSAKDYHAFGSAQRVVIRGYEGDAMEPFISKDGRHLFFNNRNDPGVDTNLHFAQRVDDGTFDYRGEVKGANSRVLDGVPSLDQAGNFYFVSVRSYRETLSTLYSGRFQNGDVFRPEPVSGVSLQQPGMLIFDAEISADGNTLFVADGKFTGGALPKTADIVIAVREGSRFRRLAGSGDLLKNVNTQALEYAPAMSTDLLELFFTRFDHAGGWRSPVIYRAARASVTEPFGAPQRVAAASGFVEAATLSGDGRTLYFHRRDEKRYVIYRTSR